MTLRDRLRGMVATLPDEASVSLPVMTVKRWLRENGEESPPNARPVTATGDLALSGFAELVGVSASRARSICREDQALLGSYKRGRRWYVPRDGVKRWQEAEAAEYRRSRERSNGVTGRTDEIDFQQLRKELRENGRT